MLEALFFISPLLLLLTFPAEAAYIEPFEYDAFIPDPNYHMPLPNFIQPCSKRSKTFNLCMKTTLQKLFGSIINGSVELNIPKLEPLYVRHMDINQGSGDVSLNLKLRDITFFGLAASKIISVRSNMEDFKLEVTIKNPYMNLVGDFTANGGIKSLPIVSEGEFAFNMTDVSSAWIIYLRETEETFQGKKYLLIDRFTVDLIPVEMHIKFGSVLDGDEKLGTVMNKFINDNAQEIFELNKPEIMEALSSVFVNLANRVLTRFPAETLLPP